MAAGFDYLAQAGVRNAEAQVQDKRDQRNLQLQTALQNATTPEEQQAVIHDAYAKDPSHVKQFVENLGRRMVGKQPQEAASPYAAPPPVTPPAGPDGSSGELTSKQPAPRTKQEAFAGHAARGKLPETPDAAEARKHGYAMDEIKARGENKPSSGKAVWLKGEDGQERPFELKNGAYVPVEAPQGATPAPPPARPPAPESDYQKAQIDYRNKVLAFQQAKQKAAENPNSPQAKAALLRAQGEAERSQAYMIRAKAGASGTDLKGNPLPGAVTDAEGNPVGSMFAGNIKPTGVEIQRADLAGSTLEQIDSVKSLIAKRPDLFGPAAGRATDFTQWLGSQDPDAQKFKAATDIIASHLSGVYGARGAYSQGAIAKTIGENRTNPAALTAALNQYSIAAKNIQAKGTRHTVGGSPQNPNAGPAPKAAQGGGWTTPKDAPSAPKEDGKVLKADGKVIAKSKGGQWVQP